MEPDAKKSRTVFAPYRQSLRLARNRRIRGYGPDEQGGPLRPFRFVQMADTQLGMVENLVPGSQNGGWAEELRLTRLCAEQVNRLRPAFAIVCGDLIDEWPSEERGRKASKDPKVKAAQEKDLKEAWELIDPDIPLLCLCGNHDIGNRPNAKTIASWVETWGDDYFTFWCQGVKCLVVNSQLWKDDTDAKAEREAMDKWMDKELESQGSEPPPPLLVFSHISPFIFKQDEPNGYFNTEQTKRAQLLDKFARCGCIGWFCGHYHRNAGGTYRHAATGRSYDVVITAAVGGQLADKEGGDPLSHFGAPSLGEHLSGFRIVDVHADGRVDHPYRTITELKADAEAEASATQASG